MVKKNDTIFALSTPAGKSAIALIRISGVASYNCVNVISKNMPVKANIATYNELVDLDKNIIDQSVTTFFKSPKSFTGEDMVEIAIHGGGAVIKKLTATIIKNNKIRLARPGEFTRRAFENNKLDLTQVEAISDIVDAETEMQRKQAISHLSGNFSKFTKQIFDNLKKILANIEAIIDFTDEDLPEGLMINIKEQIENNIIKIENTLLGSDRGISIRGGFLVSIIGKPNTGKSSFINNISGRDVSIVTQEPGTTRDLIESFIDVGGYPVKFLDTAGIRESSNIVERIGVKKALNLSKEAHINLVFIENQKDLVFFSDIKNAIFIKSKQDILMEEFSDLSFYNISSKTNFGINEILEVIKEKIENKMPSENFVISRERHVECLKETLEHLISSKEDKNIDLFAEDIRMALNSISYLFGSIDIEEILDIIFSDFCIGK